MKVLVIKLSSLGDIIHTFPAVMDIKNNYPNSQIDWLVDDSFIDLVKLNPNINKVIPISLRKWKHGIKILDLFRWIKINRHHIKYDYIIDFQGLLKSAIVSRFFSGKVYGYSLCSIREKLACCFYNKTFYIQKNQLAIKRNRLLASKIFNYSVNLDICDFGFNFRLDQNLGDDSYIIFFHATSKDSKKYDLNRWANLAISLINKYNVLIYLPYGNDGEYKESVAIKGLIKSNKVIIPNRMNYFELADFIKNAYFIFGVDTGLLHLSNAFNKPLVGIYTDTDPNKTGVVENSISKNIGNVGEIIKVNDLIMCFEHYVNYDKVNYNDGEIL